MCFDAIVSLFNPAPPRENKPATPTVNKPVTSPVQKPRAQGVTVEKRQAGVVKGMTNFVDPQVQQIAGGNASSIGSPIGVSEGPRKRTTELGL